MIIEFNGASLNVSEIENSQQAFKFLENLEPHDKLDLRGAKPLSVNLELFAPYDFLTGKEKALVNLDISLAEKIKKLREKLFPANEALANSIAQIVAGKEIQRESINTSEWEDYVKCLLLRGAARSYIEYSLFNRLGYDLHYVYDADAKIYAIKDLRDVHKSPINPF
jgi:hypothetical protein